MPNWAFGTVQASGKKENVKNFIEQCFLSGCDERPNKFKDIKYFARTFINDRYEVLFNEFENELSQVSSEDECTYSFPVYFAWSAYTCLIDGYPQKFTNECIDLSTACKKYNVDIALTTEEEGIGFEEHIICNRYGEIIKNECIDMLRYECVSCGNTQLFPRQESEYCCIDCGKEGIANWHLKLD